MGLTADHPSPEFKSECSVRDAADRYRLCLQALRASKISADECRAETRKIKRGLTDMEWQRAKFWAIHTL